MIKRAEDLIQKLQLQKHPEGGYFKEVYRSNEQISKTGLPNRFAGSKSFGTSIYFMLTSDSFSAFHKINQDETWHFYEGSTIELHMINTEGVHSTVLIGSKLEEDNHFQFTVSGNVWFAAKVIESNNYSLVGCTVAPGFDFDDFSLANRNDLISSFPNCAEIIEQFTRE
ncbi:MAG: cupin domain-containing protein [Ekhidna sp.]